MFDIILTGVPRCIRMDAGTENVVVADLQRAFRWYHDDDMSGEKSVIIGSSHTNQVCKLGKIAVGVSCQP